MSEEKKSEETYSYPDSVARQWKKERDDLEQEVISLKSAVDVAEHLMNIASEHRDRLVNETVQLRVELAAAKKEINKPVPPPVDRSARESLKGGPIADDHREIDNKTGMQKDYVVLSKEERDKGFVRPVRTSYKHEKCGGTTTMNRALAETYARDPEFYSGTFCSNCGAHFPVGATGEFVWFGTDIKVGT